MPELRLPDWLTTRLAALERTYGTAQLLLGEDRQLLGLCLSIPSGVILVDLGDSRFMAIDAVDRSEQFHDIKAPIR